MIYPVARFLKMLCLIALLPTVAQPAVAEENLVTEDGAIRILRDPKLKYSLIRASRSKKRVIADHLAVELKPGKTLSDITPLLRSLSARVRKAYRQENLYLIAFDGTQAGNFERIRKQLALSPSIDSVSEDRLVTLSDAQTIPNDPEFGQLWGLHNTGASNGIEDKDIDAPEAWVKSTCSARIRVGVIDTGIDYDHPDLKQNIWSNPGESGLDLNGKEKRSNGVDDDGNGYVDDWRGWDFVSNDNDPKDDHMHGTHVAGTIAAVGGNSIGVTGVCWRASLVSIKIFDPQGAALDSDAARAIKYAARLGVRVINASWGDHGIDRLAKPSDLRKSLLAKAIDFARRSGTIVVAAAGNGNDDNDEVDSAGNELAHTYPSDLLNSNIISVGASNKGDKRASFSNWGKRSVDLFAPGTDIFSTLPGYETQAMKERGLSVGYGLNSGTSMAAPHVSGAVAMVMSLYPKLSIKEVKRRVLAGVDVGPWLKDLCLTGGRLNLARTISIEKTQTFNLAFDRVSIADSEKSIPVVKVTPGRKARIHVSFKNTGELTSPRLTVRASTEQAALVSAKTATLNLISSGGSEWAGPFEIEVPATAKLGGTVSMKFVVSYRADDGEWRRVVHTEKINVGELEQAPPVGPFPGP